MPSRAYGTYFDSGYLARGITLIESLRAHGEGAPVWVLALDDETKNYIDASGLANVFAITIAEIEAVEPGLLPLKAGRSRMEYYFTSTPLLLRWIMRRQDDPSTTVIYLDADLFFFDDPNLVLEELAGGSVGIIEHRYPSRLEKRLAKYGRFNVGWVGFRSDEKGRACLDWWAASTLEWCFDRPEDGKYADQGYLDWFPDKFEGVAILQPAGFDLAPWNTARHRITRSPDGSVNVDSASLVFFHFHGLRRVGSWYVTSQLIYGSRLTRALRNDVYLPYLRQLETATARVNYALGKPAVTHKRGNGWRGIVSRLRKSTIDQLTIATGNALSLRSIDVRYRTGPTRGSNTQVSDTDSIPK